MTFLASAYLYKGIEMGVPTGLSLMIRRGNLQFNDKGLVFYHILKILSLAEVKASVCEQITQKPPNESIIPRPLGTLFRHESDKFKYGEESGFLL
jgi:hypothetical protein